MRYNRKMGTIRNFQSNIIISIYKNALMYMLIQSFKCIFLKSISIKTFPSMKCRKKDSHPFLYIAHVENLK